MAKGQRGQKVCKGKSITFGKVNKINLERKKALYNCNSVEFPP